MALTLVISACGDSSSNDDAGSTPAANTPADIPKSAPGEIEEINWAEPYPVNSLDPAKGADGGSLLGLAIGLEPLVAFKKDGTLEPVIAESWEEVDASHYVYNIRQGVKFWNGDTLTVEDVLFSLTRHSDPAVASQMADGYSNVESIEKTGPWQITITLKKPDATFKFIPAYTSFIIQKKHAEQVGNKDLGSPQGKVMGTGPYEFKRHVPDEVLETVRFEDYWGEKPAAKKVNFRVIEDDSTRLLAMRTGDLDGSFVIPPEQFTQWSELDNAYTYTRPSADTYMFFFNVTKKPFDDVHVRRAFAYALDKEALATRLLRGQAEPATQYVSKLVFANLMTPEETDAFYDTLPSYDFDVEKAKEELAQSAYPDGFDVTVKVPAGTDQLTKAALALGQQLKELNINMKIQEMPASQWLTRISNHDDLGFETLGTGSQIPDPNYMLGFLSEDNAKANGVNYASFKDPKITQLYKDQISESDQGKRLEALKEMMRVAAEELPYLGVYWQDVNVAVSNDIVYDDLSPWYYQTNWAKNLKRADSAK